MHISAGIVIKMGILWKLILYGCRTDFGTPSKLHPLQQYDEILSFDKLMAETLPNTSNKLGLTILVSFRIFEKAFSI
jgi:hypothetical protein